ncbi:NAD(P)-dependent oxidoreductase [Rhodococcus sp. BP-349]|uniref:NAD-dependent epimerase/dehydratase family protein n=1 Tax=unclassified Rhodococcus (in: high G+C Gram-positive bacteria) TaxID=192944 RepID=UPI001C9A4E4E|nr:MULTISPECIES: NAD(P)-dependent oxidoreductase [unclassified Rhodococcus (in: high G+C Gram-positive bacteria)]MBY6538839.1 NAD(P)-dependent oxidoreductase [Rhodococcus sp. BP-363]MBY6543176.1 NAD(P)-dependent oxidoreductase [Rhodococcus sp. BP-369]MBY6562406.1 NAD(P)-dependent oxidoreductase [Rhodococcus sp. BP-370]MBY6576698.1 NAD(P)-dependent oxidoreductase [Rhodococcus sp. BP-364]MBY6585999.1 NAD(P)-dependent oxidoreductase [Rhodococcus sp. BP-358]
MSITRETPPPSVTFDGVDAIEDALATPSPALIEAMSTIDGDIVVLGVGGKVGPSVAAMAQRAADAAGTDTRVFGVARFSDPHSREFLQRNGVECVPADLTDDEQLQRLPDAANVIYMAGHKFGTTGNESFTWSMNSYLPGRVATRYRDSRIVAFSTLVTYPLADVTTGGSRESDPSGPIGEYAASCVGRERIFEHHSKQFGTPVVLFRLGYSIETRYGVLQEIAQAVKDGVEIPLEMGHASVIWQRDVADYAIRSLTLAQSPPRRLNITGPEIVSIRWLAHRFGEKLGREPIFSGRETGTAYVMDGSALQAEFGFPTTTLSTMIDAVAAWVADSGDTLGKPTKFQQRQGLF